MENAQQKAESEKLIQILSKAMTDIEALKHVPEAFSLRSARTILILRNGIANALGVDLIGDSTTQEEIKPITDFWGRDVRQKKESVTVDPLTQNAIDSYREKIWAIIYTIADQTEREFYDKYLDSEVRGVAKLLGIAVTNTDPEVITMEFVSQIFAQNELRLEKIEVKKITQGEVRANVNNGATGGDNALDQETQDSVAGQNTQVESAIPTLQPATENSAQPSKPATKSAGAKKPNAK